MDRKVPYVKIALYLTAALILITLWGLNLEKVRSFGSSGSSGDNSPNILTGRPEILGTGYSLLNDIGGEEPGYGLYSYALMVDYSDRSTKFLNDVFIAIRPVESLPTPRSQLNLLSIPLKKSKTKEMIALLNVNNRYLNDSSAAFAQEFYDYEMARALLDHICDPPAEEVKVVCEGDLSRGPYIFSYAKPASKLALVPPPFLFMDLSDFHERAFPEIIAAFRAQVKREDISDRAKIDTLRLKLLSIVLTAADWVSPAQKAMADILHVASGPAEKDNK